MADPSDAAAADFQAFQGERPIMVQYGSWAHGMLCFTASAKTGEVNIVQ
jgi:hypothetical protein